MNIKFLFSALLVSLMLRVGAQAETFSYGQLQYIKLTNGMNMVLMPNKAEKKVTITTVVRFGTVYENDTIPGLAHVLQLGIKEKLLAAIRANKDGLHLQNTSLKTSSTSEQTYFEFTTDPAQVAACFRLIRDSIFKSTLSLADIKNALAINQTKQEESLQNNRNNFEQKIQSRIFRKDYERLDIHGKPEKYVYFTPARVDNYKQKYYVSGNTLFTTSGNITLNNIQAIFEPTFATVFRTPFNPETVTKLIDFKPMIYSTQVVVNENVPMPEMHICWQFPGAISHSSASYAAHVLTAMLNDNNNYIQIKAAKLGAKRLEAIYDVNSFSGVFRLMLRAEKDHLFSVYNFVLNEILRLERTLVNETMVQAGQLQFKRNYQFIQSTTQYPQQVVKFWPYNDASYYQTLGDSVMNVTEQKMKRFVLEMIKESPHVSALLISETDQKAMNLDSLFAETDDKINEYTFTYGANITDPDSSQNMAKLKILLQWLKTNADVYIQINGFADVSEFDKVSDNEVLAMMDTIPTFRKMNPDVFKKKTFRPEMLRAMKIIRYLYMNGISPDRLSGTSMTYNSNNKEEAAANMKCTITLTKMRSNPSLYEYHYGQKKQ
jgi:predicted Zn-dependent peptidase